METAAGQFDRAGLKAARAFGGRKRFLQLEEMVGREINAAPRFEVGIDMFSVYAHLYRSGLQYQRRHPVEHLNFTSGDRIGEAFCEAAYGLFPQAGDLQFVQQAYVDVTDAKSVAPDIDAWRKVAEGGARYPLRYTLHDLERQFADRGDPSVFIFDPLHGPDVIDAWNFRLFNRDPLLVNVHWLEQSREHILQRIHINHRPLPTNPHGVMIGTAMHIARSLDSTSVLERLNLPADLPQWSVTTQDWYEPIWLDRDEERVFQPSLAMVHARRQTTELTPTGSSELSIRPPVLAPGFETNLPSAGPAWVNTVQIRSYNFESPLAEALPSAATPLTDYAPVRGLVDAVYPSREGYVAFRTIAETTGTVQIATRNQAVTSWLKSRELEAKPSDAGRIAEQVISSLGGLWGAHLLKSDAILKLLDSMARSRVVRADGTTEEFPDSTALVKTWVDTVKKVDQRKGGFGKNRLDALVEAKALQLGLTAPCPHCAKENWFSLDEVATIVRCLRCRQDFAFPQSPPSKDRFRYRVFGPFATPHYAQGGYCVALTLAWLNDFRSMDPFTYTTSLELKRADGHRLETDFFAWKGSSQWGRRCKDPQTLVGECKSLAAEGFKAGDIDRLKTLAEALPGAFLVCATLKPAFSAQEISRLKGLAKWGWHRRTADRQPTRVILLTGVDLLADETGLHPWEKAGGRLSQIAKETPHVFGLGELAVLTQRGHLGFTSEEVGDLQWPRLRRRLVQVAAAG
ncbi:hypothetical protein [Brevundimonas sp. TSRC1-1]|uniref:hypothetical protein n=1 Tax=Brevundimonas sp. TSRC1-1 TaxID=2804562 RepID=UPI003CEB3AF2